MKLASLAILLTACLFQTHAVELPPPVVPQCFGVNIHFTRAPDAELDKLAEIGFKFVRMDMSWGSIERKKGEYNFEPYDGLVESMSKRGIRTLFILDYANRLYDNGVGPSSEEGIAAFGKACAAAAKHFDGKHILWEIWNEPNLDQFFKPHADAEAYSKIVIAAVDAIRAADPKATVIGPASSTFPWEFYDVMIKRGAMQKFDAISVHPYRQNDPETAARDYQRLKLTLARAGIDKPLLSGEWGYSTGWKNMPEDRQARYLVRQWLSNLANDVHLSIWYDWKDDGDDPKEAEHHFGSVHRDLKDKPASNAARVLCKTLDGYEYIARLAQGDGKDFILLLRKDNKPAAAIWTTGQPHALSVKLPGKSAKLISVLGESKGIQAGADGFAIEVTDSPQYLIVDNAAPAAANWKRPPAMRTLRRTEPVAADYTILSRNEDAVAVSLDLGGDLSARVSLLMMDPLRVQICTPTISETVIRVENPSGAAFTGRVRVGQGTAGVTTDVKMARGTTEALVTIPWFINANPAAPIVATVLDDHVQTVAESGPVLWKAVKLDGGLGAWTEGDNKIAGSASAELADAPEPPVAGMGKAVKITYRLGNGWRYAVATPKANAIDFEAKELGMWLYGDGSGNKLVCRVADKTGQVFQASYGAITWTGWRWVTMRFAGDDVYHFGGANDGVIHYPIKLQSMVLLDNAKREVDKDLTVYVLGAALR